MALTNNDHLQRALDGVHGLTARIKQDRGVSVGIRDTLFASHVVGDGFLPGAGREGVDETQNQEQTLFVNQNEESDNDAEYAAGGDDVLSEDEDGMYATDDGGSDTDGDLLSFATAKWLNGLASYIKSLHGPPQPGFPTPCPHLALEPRDHQYRALGMIEHSSRAPFKAMLVADPPGLGKTLISMMAIVKAISSARRFSIVVVPSSCVEQWDKEFARFFVPGAVRVLVVRDPTIPPTTMLQYDVIIVSYAFVMSRYRKLLKFLERIALLKKNGTGLTPERPDLSIFSELFDSDDGVKSPYLVLDEVNAVKNSKTVTFAAVLELRRRCETCLMLTGSPIDNSWPDIFSLLQFVQGHNIRKKKKMMQLLGTPNLDHPGRWTPPTGQRFLRLVQILNSFVVRRPESTINLPPMQEHTVRFRLSQSEVETSNAAFVTYLIAMRIAAKKGNKGGRKGRGTSFKSLTHALQHACHPQLTELMEFIRFSGEKHQIAEDEDVLYDAEAIAKWTAWREMLKSNNNWQSSRIMALIDAFNKQRDLDPSCSVIIFDESVYFLDIVQIAFAAMYDPVECLRYDGREVPEKRGMILAEFKEADGLKVLLVSRGAGGVGLNIPWANVVILCGPWWKKEWEQQAMKRVWRPGQTRPVTFVTLFADNCRAEHYKAKARDRKHKFNSKVVRAITRGDDDQPKVWDNFQ